MLKIEERRGRCASLLVIYWIWKSTEAALTGGLDCRINNNSVNEVTPCVAGKITVPDPVVCDAIETGNVASNVGAFVVSPDFRRI